MVMQVPNERAMPSSISLQAQSSRLPARFSAQYFQTSLPLPRTSPRQLPRSMGPADTKMAGRFALVAPMMSAGHGLVAAAEQHHAVHGVGADDLLRLHRQQVAVEHRRRLHVRLAHGEDGHLQREAARLPDAALHLLRAQAEVGVAGVRVAPGVEDADDGAARPFRLREPRLLGARAVGEGAQVRAARTSGRCAGPRASCVRPSTPRALGRAGAPARSARARAGCARSAPAPRAACPRSRSRRAGCRRWWPRPPAPGPRAARARVPRRRAGPRGEGTGGAALRPPSSPSATQASNRAWLSAGARQPEPVVNPGRSKAFRCADRRPLAHAADHEAAIHALEQGLQVGIVERIGAHHRVFDADAHAGIHEPRHGVEARRPVAAERPLLLEIEDRGRSRPPPRSRASRPRGPAASRGSLQGSAIAHAGIDGGAAAAPGRGRGRTTGRRSGWPSGRPGTPPSSRASLRIRRGSRDTGTRSLRRGSGAARPRPCDAGPCRSARGRWRGACRRGAPGEARRTRRGGPRVEGESSSWQHAHFGAGPVEPRATK